LSDLATSAKNGIEPPLILRRLLRLRMEPP
jgi:hypothetical protein